MNTVEIAGLAFILGYIVGSFGILLVQELINKNEVKK